MIESLEVEIVTIRKDLQEKNGNKMLDETISNQRTYYDNSRLGYNQMQTQKGSSSKKKEHEAEQSTYAEIVKGT
jgi:hypothetical protein